MINFVAIDVDDTLINRDLDITPANKLAIDKLREKDIIVTLATGRMFRSALPYAEELGMDLPLITYHGALIKQAQSKEVLHHCPVPMDLATQIIRLAKDKDVQLNLYINDELIVESENEYTDYYKSVAQVPCKVVGDLEDFLEEPPTKMTVIESPQRVERLNCEFAQFFGDELLITQSKSHFLEITHPKANKGEAVMLLAEMYNITMDQVLAIGDSLNDIPMIQKAGVGVAVGNARPQVKQVADAVVSSHEESGVAEAIEKFVLSEWGREYHGVS